MLPLGHTLYLWRLEKKLTQEELARLSGVSRPNLSALEHGGRDATVQTVRRLAHVLGVRPGIIVDGTPPGDKPINLGRKNLDHIARFLVGQHVRLSSEEAKIAEILKVLVRSKIGLLTPTGQRPLPKTARHEQACLLKAKSILGSQQMKNIISRVEKIMGVHL